MTETLNTLIEQTHHIDRNVRSAAVMQLGRLASDDALAALLDVLGVEPDFYVREDISWALARIGDAAVLPLIERLRDENPAIRHHAAHVLSKIRDVRAVDGMIEALQDSDVTVVTKAAFALGQFGDVRAIAALVQIVGHEDREVQGTIDSVLKGFREAAVQPLIDILSHERWQVREHAVDILALLRGENILTAVVGLMNDPEWQVRFSVTNALGIIGGSQAQQGLEAMQNDAHPRVRELASKMITRLKTRRVKPLR